MNDSCRIGGAGGLVIPDLTSDGWLPPGRHPASLEDIELIFVKRAPHADHRDLLFRTLTVYLDMVQQLLPRGSAWVDGGFCTYKDAAPHDVDITLLVPRSRAEDMAFIEQFLPLLTLKDVHAEEPVSFMSPRMQPMGGKIDAFLCVAGDPAQEQYWDTVWSSVKGSDGEIVDGETKGYLEVTW